MCKLFNGKMSEMCIEMRTTLFNASSRMEIKYYLEDHQFDDYLMVNGVRQLEIIKKNKYLINI